jgi:preprotein translocase subunit SecG
VVVVLVVVVAVVVVIVAVVVQSSYGESDIGRAESARVAKGIQQAIQACTPSSIQLPFLFLVLEMDK